MTQLTHFTGGTTHGFGPAWSPDGGQIVWHKLGPQVNQLFVMDKDGRNQRQLTHMPGNAKISHPDWG
jgi:Tol biopolymer transport system component